MTTMAVPYRRDRPFESVVRDACSTSTVRNFSSKRSFSRGSPSPTPLGAMPVENCSPSSIVCHKMPTVWHSSSSTPHVEHPHQQVQKKSEKCEIEVLRMKTTVIQAKRSVMFTSLEAFNERLTTNHAAFDETTMPHFECRSGQRMLQIE